MTSREHAEELITKIPVLVKPRGQRLPVIIWRLNNIQGEDAELAGFARQLNERGLATVTSWNYRGREKNLPYSLRYARLLQQEKLPVVINSTGVMHRFFNGDEKTAHVDADGTPFFDLSQTPKVKIGCPFATRHRYPAIREQVETFVKAYHNAGLPLDIVIADWEIDGPMAWNDAWEHAKRCTRCRQHIPKIDDFRVFQKAYRTIRDEMQRECYAKVVLEYYPKALVGNYAEYPHDGWHHWYDYFEIDAKPPLPVRMDQGEPVRPWVADFAAQEYTFGMPVVYTWYRTFGWYDFANSDYRWFYNMLKVATNASKSAPADLPIITFVHWHTTAAPKEPDELVKQMSEGAYQELLWHMLLRGHYGLAMWCTPPETLKETQLVQQVYAESLAYSEFIEQGTPVSFEIPKQPGTVISGLRLANRLLVRRTDFGEKPGPAAIRIDGKDVLIPTNAGHCQILTLAAK
jgi:hypothetical protein